MTSSQLYLNKIAFWQKLSAIVVALIGLSLLGIFTWTLINTGSGSGFRDIETFLLFLWLCIFVFCGACLFLAFMLWRSATALGRYQLHGIITDLEQSFRFQRYFWIGGTIIVACILMLMFFGLVA